MASYVEVALAAPNLREAEENGIDAAARLLGDVDPDTHQPSIVASDRLSREQLADLLKTAATKRRTRTKRAAGKPVKAEDFDVAPPPNETEPLKAGQIWLARVVS